MGCAMRRSCRPADPDAHRTVFTLCGIHTFIARLASCISGWPRPRIAKGATFVDQLLPRVKQMCYVMRSKFQGG
jgi:hypothetical protein